jgi:fluoride ion exporter CrcB/FEX
VLAAIAVGGVLGAEARYGLGVAIPHAAGQWPWATFLTNLGLSSRLILWATRSRGMRESACSARFDVGCRDHITSS